MPGQRQQRVLLNKAAAADYLGVTERFMTRCVSERRIPYYKVGSLVRWAVSDLDAYLEVNRREAGAAGSTASEPRGKVRGRR